MISAIIITRNEEHNIVRTLKALQSPLITEIIVSDSNSSDNTKSKVLEVAEIDARVSFYSYTTSPFTAARGRHEGVKHIKEISNGYILFLDGDMELEPDFLAVALKCFERQKDLAWLSGQMDNVFYRDDGSLSHMEDNVYDISKQTVGGGALIKKDVYIMSKGFNPELIVNEESELEYRFNKLGFRSQRIGNKMFLHHTEIALSKSRFLERFLDKKITALSHNFKIALTDFGYMKVLVLNNAGFFSSLIGIGSLLLLLPFATLDVLFLCFFVLLICSAVFHRSFRVALNYIVYAVCFLLYILFSVLSLKWLREIK